MKRLELSRTTARTFCYAFGQIGEKMKLTIWNRIKICVEVLTIRSGHSHTAQEKQLSIFQHGYAAGLADGKLEFREVYITTL